MGGRNEGKKGQRKEGRESGRMAGREGGRREEDRYVGEGRVRGNKVENKSGRKE